MEDYLKILIAEDDEANYKVLMKNLLLYYPNAEIIRAVNGEKAVELCLSDDNISIVLMDIRMPEMNGYIATKEIKSFKPELPIIAQTSFSFDDDKAKSIIYGCDDYISKPYDFNELVDKINFCLEI